MAQQGLNCDLESIHIGHVKRYKDGPWLDMLAADDFMKRYTEHMDEMKCIFPQVRAFPGPYEVEYTIKGGSRGL